MGIEVRLDGVARSDRARCVKIDSPGVKGREISQPIDFDKRCTQD